LNWIIISYTQSVNTLFQVVPSRCPFNY
jgi:hypothetical protein